MRVPTLCSSRGCRGDSPLALQLLLFETLAEKHLVEPYPPVVIRTIRAFAWTALAIGTLIVLWIVYAMVFAYR